VSIDNAMPRGLALSLAAALTACGGAPAVVPPTRSAARPPAPPVAPMVVPVPFDAEALALPTPVDCRWRGQLNVSNGTDEYRLCLERDTLCYASMRQGGAAWVAVGGEADPVALVEVDDSGLLLDGMMPLGAIRLELQVSEQFSGYFVPSEVRVAPGRTWHDLEAELDVGTGILHPSKMIWSCHDIGISSPLLGVGPEEGGQTYALTADRVPLSATPGGPVLLEIARDAVGETALEFSRRRGRFARITLETSGGFLEGWVPAEAIERYEEPYVPPGTPVGHGANGGCENVVTNGTPAGAVCAQALPLFARVDGRAARVGQISKGAHVRLGAPHDGVIDVESPRSLFRDCSGEEREVPDVSLLDGAELFVRAEDAAECR
jgi:hypothetical protein